MLLAESIASSRSDRLRSNLEDLRRQSDGREHRCALHMESSLSTYASIDQPSTVWFGQSSRWSNGLLGPGSVQCTQWNRRSFSTDHRHGCSSITTRIEWSLRDERLSRWTAEKIRCVRCRIRTNRCLRVSSLWPTGILFEPVQREMSHPLSI